MTFCTLPTELRLQIASYAVEQPSNAGLIYEEKVRHEDTGIYDMFYDERVPGLRLDMGYLAKDNLSLLRVCRQFRDDFSELAYRRTRFILSPSRVHKIRDQPTRLMQNIRRIAFFCDLQLLSSWQKYPFNDPRLQLDEICVALFNQRSHNDKYPVLSKMLRRLQNVRSIQFVVHPSGTWEDRTCSYTLVGALLKEDHYQRYDAPNAPNVGSTWWTWQDKGIMKGFFFTAVSAKPIMEEQAYLEAVKPMIDEALLNASSETFALSL